MKIRLTLRRASQESKDLSVTVDGLATVGDIARKLYAADPARKGFPGPGALTLTVDEAHGAAGAQGRVLDPSWNLLESGLRSGSTVGIAETSEDFIIPGQNRGPAVATLRVLEGPERGQEFPLPAGTSYIGRDRSVDIRLSDPLTSKRHARITVGEIVEIVDLNSANGLILGGMSVSRATLQSNDEITLGETTIAVVRLSRAGGSVPNSPLVEYNRSPRVVPRWSAKRFVLPDGPERPRPHKFPFIVVLAPLLLGAVLFGITQNVLSGVFILMTPLFALANFFEQKFTAKRELKASVAEFRAAMDKTRENLQAAQDLERTVRLQETPSVGETVDAIKKLAPLLWTHRPEHRSFLSLRLGLGTMPSRIVIEDFGRRGGTAEHMEEIRACAEEFATVDGVPIVCELRQSGALGVAGPRGVVDDVARSLVIQLVGLHSPAEVVLVAVTSHSYQERWSWLQWLPHTGSVHSPLKDDHLAAGTGAGSALLARLEDLLGQRESVADTSGAEQRGRLDDEIPAPSSPPQPAVVVIVEDDANVDRGRLTRLAERGPDVGIFVIWVAASQAALPAVCRDYLVIEDGHDARTGAVRLGRVAYSVVCEGVSAELAGQLGRMLAPLVDVGKPVDDDSDLPRAVSYLSLTGAELAESTRSVADRWKESNSLAASAVANQKAQGSLRALVGSKGMEPMYLDLKNDGPHALVGGTTGSGKSEFLQSWVLGMAAAYSPDRVNFLLVDYKGGSAFADCVQLPHTVGLVTDLSPHMVRRALTSLRAELRYREHLFQRKNAKDLLAMERNADPDTPPYLVIVVDEFAALATEVPEFVDGVVDVAARGRSLGLHLILATQRPAGVIRGSLRSNTNLRIALRMADTDDSRDILDTPAAAYFDPSIPGRGAAKTGPGRIQGFQTGYASGWTTDRPAKPRIDIVEMAFGSGQAWELDEESAVEELPAGPNDISRIVGNINRAAQELGLQKPRKPWLSVLANTYDFAKLPTQRTDAALPLGIIDDPETQSQPTAIYQPDTDGNMAIYGTGGSGKSTALRGIAIAAAVTPKGGPVHVYGIDCGSGGLHMLEALPHVGSIIAGDDEERVGRLLRWLRDLVDERAGRYSALHAGTITDYRMLAGQPDEPRILLFVDGLSSFRESYEFVGTSPLFNTFLQIAADGRPVGVHIVVTGDRASSVPASLGATIQRRLVLRLASEEEYLLLGEPRDVLNNTSVPGRGLLEHKEVQLAVLGGSSNLAVQSRHVQRLTDTMLRQNVLPAPEIQRLPEQVQLRALPAGTGEHVVLGLDDESLQPRAVVPRGVLMVAGPPGSGRSTTLMALADSLKRSNEDSHCIYVAPHRTDITSQRVWDRVVIGVNELQNQIQALSDMSSFEHSNVAWFFEGLTEFTRTPVEADLIQLINTAARADHWVVGESETSTWAQASSLLKPFKSGRQGLLLSPSPMDGDTLVSTPLGKVERGKFVPGRGHLVSRGRVHKVQVGYPDSVN